MHFVSPNYTHAKLESPSYTDIVDVFEDRMRNWLLAPAGQLLNTRNGSVAAVALLMSYFEGIEIYRSGKDSHHKSKEFFGRGFKRVFGVDPSGEHVFDEMINALYVQARCGFAHDGLFRNRVFFSTVRPQAINATWPRKDGVFVKGGHLESVIINPPRFCEAIEIHFNKYMTALRAEEDSEMKVNFLAAIELKWALNEPGRIVGMTEEEFHNGA
jgi:hypothetical protein